MAYFHERRASNTNTAVFLRSRPLTMSKLSKLRLSLSGSSLSAQKAADGIRTAGVFALSHPGAPMTDRFGDITRVVLGRIHSLVAMAMIAVMASALIVRRAPRPAVMRSGPLPITYTCTFL